MDLLGKVLKRGEGGRYLSKVESDLKKIPPVMVAAWLCDPVVHKQPKGIFQRQAGGQGAGKHTSLGLSQLRLLLCQQ